MNCPNCKSTLYPDSLIVNKDIRRKVEDHMRTAYSKRPTKGSNLVENIITKEEDLGSESKEENKNE
jgi:aspartate/tyrosine/aromatic aminotransferase